MDALQRDTIIAILRRDAFRSLKKGLKAWMQWWDLSEQLAAKHASDPGALYIAKRDNMQLRDYLEAYNLYRENSSWANSMIEMLSALDVEDARR